MSTNEMVSTALNSKKIVLNLMENPYNNSSVARRVRTTIGAVSRQYRLVAV